ncbi:MAG TPA: LD-carboxypeptidase [Oligoflexia bacterium]|nr:LD-carboxypeptidase [Oligoflexia bacterium]HMR25532.1 LD-carboxypeptidase [Oligoflexia bacterium]
MKKPAGLLKKDRVYMVACSSPFDQQNFKNAKQYLSDAGLKVTYARSVFAKRHYLAGTDKQRLQGMQQALKDKKAKALFFARGGYGCTRILPFTIDQAWPDKIIMGLSDVTPLLNWYALKKKCQTIHGPVLCGEQFHSLNLRQKNHILGLLSYPGKKQILQIERDYKVHKVKSGKARILGGNLSMLCSSVGTSYAVKPKNAFLFLEEVNEPAYKVDRMLTQLFQTGFLNECKAVFLGDFTDLNGDFHANAWLLALIQDLMKKQKINIPIVYGLKSGHVHADILWPIGGWVEIAKNGKQIVIDCLVQ